MTSAPLLTAEQMPEKAAQIRRQALHAALKANKGHVPPAFSWVEIGVSLFYGGLLNVRPKDPRWPERDRFLLSKGHGCLTLYAILADLGFFDKGELETFTGNNAMLAGHPDLNIPGIENLSGSLGHGLGIGCGIAMGARLSKAHYRTVVLLGDGECQEGSVWEAAMFAGHHQLKSLTAIVDRNRLSATAFTEDVVRLDPLADRWQSFGWEVTEVDGHDFASIHDALLPRLDATRPQLVIANTIKGKGVDFMQNSPQWHHSLPKGEQVNTAWQQLGGL